MSVCCVQKGKGGGAGVTGFVGEAYLGSTSWEESHTRVITCVCVQVCPMEELMAPWRDASAQ